MTKPNNVNEAPVHGIVIPSIQQLLDAGVEMSVYDSDAVCGWYPAQIVSIKDATRYLEHPEKFFSGKYGVELHEYIEWKRTRGNVKCTAVNKRGKQCGRTATGGHNVFNLTEYAKLMRCGLLCSSHS